MPVLNFIEIEPYNMYSLVSGFFSFFAFSEVVYFFFAVYYFTVDLFIFLLLLIGICIDFHLGLL